MPTRSPSWPYRRDSERSGLTGHSTRDVWPSGGDPLIEEVIAAGAEHCGGVAGIGQRAGTHRGLSTFRGCFHRAR